MMRLAGFQRLLAQISIEEPLINQIYLLKKAEQDVHAITRSLSPGQFRSEKNALWRQIETLWSAVNTRLTPAFLDLWRCVLELDEAPESIQGALEAIGRESRNNRLKRLILRDIRTPGKHRGIAKQILHIGEDALESVFDEVDLDAAQRTIQTERLKAEAGFRSALETLLADPHFETDKVLGTFWDALKGLSDPLERNRYLNRILGLLVPVLQRSPSSRLITLFLQLFGRLIEGELVATVDPVVQAYADTIDVRKHSLLHMGAVLAPHDPFQRTGWVLDPSQRRVLQVIRGRSANVFLAVPPGWGKTMLSTEAIQEAMNVWFIVPTPETAKQLTGILVSSAYEMEKKKGVVPRNIRLALDGETVASYVRFPSKPDNLIVATPHQLWLHLHEAKLPVPDRIVLDEIHCIGSGDVRTRSAYEYFLKFAAFHRCLIIALSATVGRNFEPFCAWLRTLLPQPLFALQEERRFFEPERLTFRVDPVTQEVRVVPIQVLNHLRLETVQSATFRPPGLPPADVERLLEAVPSFPKPVFKAPPSQDDVACLEAEIFQHVGSTADAITSLKGSHINSESLTPYQLYRVLCAMDDTEKPLLVFVMDRKRHLEFSLLLSDLVVRYNAIVYADFKEDQPLVKAYRIAAEEFAVDDGTVEKERDLLELKRDALFYKDYYPRLKAFYAAYESAPIDLAVLATFCKDYGASLTVAEIRRLRADHVREQLMMLKPDTLRERTTEYVFHPKSRISNSLTATLLRDVRQQLGDELEHQRFDWVDLAQEFGAAFDVFNHVYETRKWSRLGLNETRRMNQKWPSDIPDGLPGMEYSYEIPWDNWFLRGLEIGLLFYSDAFPPAFQHVCMMLMNQYPLTVVSNYRMATGINCPFKATMLHGAFKGDPVEEIDPTLGTQGLYRAGRRGFDKKARHFFSGVKIEPLLVPTYHPMGRNDPELLRPLVAEDSEDFQTFVLTERRVIATAPPAVVADAVPVVAATTAPEEEAIPDEWNDPAYWGKN